MKQIPFKNNDIPSYNKKSILLIVILVILGVVTGAILSSLFIQETNERIEQRWFVGDRPPFPEDDFNFNPQPLTLSDIILPTSGVIIVCISTYLLIGLIIVYIKVFLKTSSKYIAGLLFFLTPLLIQSIFSVNTLRSLFISPAIPYAHIRESVGFGFGGLGGIIVIVSIFEIVGLTILLYLSNE
jgi:hypothetical protein